MPGQLLRAMSFMGFEVTAAVAARLDPPKAAPGATAATGAAEPKAVLWPNRAMAAVGCEGDH